MKTFAGATKGFSLLELTLALAIALIVTFALSELLLSAAKVQTQSLSMVSVENFRQQIVANVENQIAWQNTLTQGSATGATPSSAMDCLKFGSSCMVAGVPIANQPFALYDVNNNLVFDSTNPTAGFTPRGDLCNTWASPGVPPCTLRWNLTWSAICTPPDCNSPLSLIGLTLVNSDPNPVLAGGIQQVNLDVSAYSEFLYRTPVSNMWPVQQGVASNAATTYMMGQDSGGNSYISFTVGVAAGTAATIPGSPATTMIGPHGQVDVGLAKYNADGNLLWTTQLGCGACTSNEVTSQITDPGGNSYMTGDMKGTGGAFSGAQVINDSLGEGNAFLIKVDPTGANSWTTEIGDSVSSWDAEGRSVVLNGGTLWMSFHAGPDMTAIPSFTHPQGIYTLGGTKGACLAAFDSSTGNLITSAPTVNSDLDSGNGGAIEPSSMIAGTDSSGPGLFMVATYTNSLNQPLDGPTVPYAYQYPDLPSGPSGPTGACPPCSSARLVNYWVILAWAGDVLLTKYDLNGNWIWSREYGTGNGMITPWSVKQDAVNNFLISGQTQTVIAQPGLLHNSSAATGGMDAFLMVIAPNGDYKWTFELGAGAGTTTTGTAIQLPGGPTANYALSGTTNGTLSGATVYGALGTQNIFIAVIDTSGNLVSLSEKGVAGAALSGGVGYLTAGSLLILGNTSVYLNGTQYGTHGISDYFWYFTNNLTGAF